MRIRCNGEPREVGPGTTVRGLLDVLGTNPRMVAVAVNAAVVPRAEWTARALAEGDDIEVLEPVGGG